MNLSRRILFLDILMTLFLLGAVVFYLVRYLMTLLQKPCHHMGSIR